MSSGRRRTTDRHYSAEDQALDQISKEAEERIQARRQARAEAREIRLREIERQQKEEEEKQRSQSQGSDAKSVSSYSSSRRGSNDSTESDVSSKDSKDTKDQVRQYKNQLRELEEKYKAAMVTNAQLDNTKTSQVFQLELLKEQLEEQEEGMIEVQREYKDKCREYDLLKRDHENLKLEFEGIKQQIELKDKLLKESGLVIVTTDEGEFSLTKCSNMSDVPIPELGSSIISEEAAELLKKAGEGTLGNSEAKVDSVPKISDNNESVVDNKVNKDKSSSLGDDKVEVKRKNSSPEDVNAVECPVKDNTSENTGDVEDVNNNAETNKNNITDKITPVEGNVSSVDVEMKSDPVIEKDNERNNEGDHESSDSDENEVFYESKSEVSLSNMSGIGEQGVESEIADSVSIGENYQVEMKADDVQEGTVSEGDEDRGDVDVAGSFSESESIKVNRNDVECSKDKEVKDLRVKRKSGSGSSFKKLVTSESGISLESDVTYHSETDEESLIEVGEKPQVYSSDDEKLNPDFGDEKVLMRDDDTDFNQNESVNVAVSNVKFHLDPEVVSTTGSNHIVEYDSDLECKVEDFEKDKVLAANIEGSEPSVEKDAVAKVNVDVSEPQAEVVTSLSHNDEVFMSLPSGKIGNENDMIEFAKNYVTDVVLKSVDLYNKEVKEEKILIRQESSSTANIDISIPKRHYSEELVETASAVMPRKLSSGGSVEILSPVINLPSEKSGDLKYFSYKVDTDADVVLTSIEEEKNPLEGLVSMDSKQPQISGFGICYSGVKDHSDIDSDSDSSNEDTDDLKGEMESGIDFISMPVTISKDNVDSNDKKENSVEGEDIKVNSGGEDKEVLSEVNVSVDKSEEIVDSVDRSNTKTDSTEINGVDQDDFINDTKEKDPEQVQKTNEVGNNLDNVNKGIESEVREMGTVSDDVEGTVSSQLQNDGNVVIEEGAAGGPVTEEHISEAGDTSPESGSRLSGEISPNEESGHSVDSNSGKSKKKGSKKRGSKKQSKEECTIS